MKEDIRSQLDKLTVPVEVAGKLLGLGRNAAYAAAKSGEIPTLRIGGRIIVPTAALRRMLGIDDGKVA